MLSRSKMMNAADPWHPNVSNIEKIAPPKSVLSPLKNSSDKLQPFEEAYLASGDSDKLRFKVELPSDEEYTSSFAFAGVRGPEEKTAPGTLISWVGVAGSRVGDYVAPSFELPDGKILRLFHASRKRNARTPLPEPAENLPETLFALEMGSLPIKPPPITMNEHDMPTVPDAVALLAPQPVKSVLDQTNPPPTFGVITTEPFTLRVDEKKAAPAQVGDGPIKPMEPPFKLEGSMFSQRKKLSNSHSFYTTPQIIGRAFQIDWSRCNTPRFRALIAQEDDDGMSGTDIEVSEIRAAMEEFQGLIYGAFSYYAAIEDTDDGYAIGLKAYFVFLHDTKLTDNKSQYMNARALESIFTVTNVEDHQGQSLEQKALNRANLDGAMMRFEFLQVIVRIAISKYVRDKNSPVHKGDVSEAVYELLSVDLAPNLPPECTRLADVFRRKRLYNREVDAVFRKFEKPLATVFEYYSSVEGNELQLNLQAPPPAMSMAEFECLVSDCGLKKAAIEDPTQRDLMIGMDDVQVRLCFMWSQMFVSDELKRRNQLTTATFVDFLEMLGRMCTFMHLPERELLVKYECKSPKDFYDGVASGQHEGSALVKTTMGPGTGASGRGTSNDYIWQDEEASSEPLANDLETLIILILDRLDDGGDGKIQKSDLEARRKATKQKSEEVLKKRSATYEESKEKATRVHHTVHRTVDTE